MPEVRPHTDASRLPLSGKTVVVTRAADQAAGLAAPLQALGATVVSVPVIEIAAPTSWEPADDAIARLDSYDWVVLTSVNGVDAFLERMRTQGLSEAGLGATKVAAVGSATAAHLQALGIRVDLVPASFRAEGVVEAFAAIGALSGPRVLLARAEEAREVLPDELRGLGFSVDVVPVYRLVSVAIGSDVAALLSSGGADVITFASGGTARRFVNALADAGLRPLEVLGSTTVASIGPVTSETLRELGAAVDIEAPEATSASLARAIGERFEGGVE